MDLPDTAQALTIFTMILGRLEVLALIPALSISFWRG
jgi:Trk-type K+ transport system membrane component